MANDLKPEFAPPALATTATKPKQRPVPRKCRLAIELLVTGQARSIKAAAERVGCARETLTRWLSRPEGAEALRNRAAKEVAMSAGRASAKLNELIESTSAKVALDATKFSLQAANIGPVRDPSVNISIGKAAGYVISIEERPERREIVDGNLVITPIDDGKLIEGAATPVDE